MISRKFLKNVNNTLLKQFENIQKIDEKHIYIFAIVVYIIFVIVVKPVSVIEMAKLPVIQVGVLGLCVYIFNSDPMMSLLLGTAFIITLSTSTTLLSKKLPIIRSKEGFTTKESTDSYEDENLTSSDPNEGTTNDDTDSYDEDIQDDEEEEDEEEEEDSSEEESSDEDDDDEDEEDDDDDEDDEDEEEVIDSFRGSTIINKNSINDTFKNLHDAIHNLENYINVNDKK